MINVYVIQSQATQKLYVGMAKEVEARLKEHNAGKSKYTKSFRPWEIIYQEETDDWASGRKREKYFG